MGYKKSWLNSQPPVRNKSTGMLLASLESEYEERSDREDNRRERTCGSAKQGQRNKTGGENADGSPNTNEDGHLIGTTKSGDKQQQGRQNTHTSVNLGGMDKAAREYAYNSPNTNEDGHD
jgi:hypothetical protein